MKKNILIINAHQYYPSSEGKLNQYLAEFAKEFFEEANHEVNTSIIDAGYHIEEEAEKHEWADLIITQTPVYWFAGPWSYKKYIDEVFNKLIERQNIVISDGRSRHHNQQYGTGGTDHHKQFLLSSTWNAPQIAFDDKDQYLLEGKSLDETLIGISSVYKFCGFKILPGFACYDVKKAPQIETNLQQYKKILQELI